VPRRRSTLIGLLCVWPVVSGQTRADRPEFDVASIKLNKDNIGGSLARTPGGLTARNAEFGPLVKLAFQTRQVDLSRVPDALRLARFDIVAKASEKISGDQYWQMLQTLLENRFHLTYHRETRDVQLYALVFRKNGTDLGPKISRSVDPNCPVNPSGSDFCGVQAGLGRMNGQRVPMARIAQELSAFAGRPVRDQPASPAPSTFSLPGRRTYSDPRTRSNT
jgi:uncharacterized protein (TIGR03435 family)